MSRATTSAEPCALCGVNPRRPMADTCAPCRHEIAKAYFRERQRKKRAAITTEPKTTPCKCGCGRATVYPVKFATDECKAKGRRAALDRDNEKRRQKTVAKKCECAKPDHPERFGLKPHRPEPPPQRKQLISEEEQARLDAEASRRDRQWHAQFMKSTLGLESAPGQPLASKVVRPPKEVWRELEEAYRPQSSHEREIFIPAKADISY